jgi:hypothetical protein
MISGLAGRTYEDRLKELEIVTLKESRHQMDMLQTYKILNGKEKVDPSCWLTMASDSERVTRQFADPLNIRPRTPGLDSGHKEVFLLPESCGQLEQCTA